MSTAAAPAGAISRLLDLVPERGFVFYQLPILVVAITFALPHDSDVGTWSTWGVAGAVTVSTFTYVYAMALLGFAMATWRSGFARGSLPWRLAGATAPVWLPLGLLPAALLLVARSLWPWLPSWIQQLEFLAIPIVGTASFTTIHVLATGRDRLPSRFGWVAGISTVIYLALTWFSALWLYSFNREPTVLNALAAAAACILTAGLTLVRSWEAADPPIADASVERSTFEAESAWISRRRWAAGLRDVIDQRHRHAGLVGIALSGGGIRSATTCLGFLTALARKDTGGVSVLARADYLSTVSGGGWTGGALTARMARPAAAAAKGVPPGVEPPFDGGPRSWRALADTFRAHGDYLVPGGLGFGTGTLQPALWLFLGAAMNSLAGILLWVCIVNLFFHGSAHPDALNTLLMRVGSATPWIAEYYIQDPILSGPLYTLNVLALVGILGAVTVGAGSLTFVIGVVFHYRAAREAGTLCAAVGSLVLLPIGLAVSGLRGTELPAYLLLGVVGLAAVAPSIRSMSRGKILGAVGALFAGQSAVLSLTALHDSVVAPLHQHLWGGLVWCLLAPVDLTKWLAGVLPGDVDAGGVALPVASGALWLSMLVGFLASRNHTSLFGFWERQIREGFLRPVTLEPLREQDDPATAPLAAMGNPGVAASRGAPLHIVNAALNTPGSSDPMLAKRGTARFEFSPVCVGGPATGWVDTALYGEEVTLASAIAVSAAALNSQGGESIPRWARVLLSAANMGLGVWVRNPRMAANPRRFRPAGHFWTGYGLRDVIGKNSEDDSLVFVSDGGHHDNLGVTGLVERECDVVISIDAGCDPSFSCSDFTRALHLLVTPGPWHVESVTNLAKVRPPKPGGNWEERHAEEAVLQAVLHRPADGDTPEKRVTVFYVKAVLKGEVPISVRGYAEAHPAFPQESTADQFFDEAQFEAYRLLGEHLAQLASEALDASDVWKTVRSQQGPPP